MTAPASRRRFPPFNRRGAAILQTAGVLILFVLTFGILLVSCENKIIYHPLRYPEGYWTPDEIGLQVEDVFFQAADGVKLHGWFVPARDARATWLWFHGNAGNLTHRLENILQLQPLKINIFIFDYRGYGKSEGEPDSPGLSLDSKAAYDWLIQKKGIPSDRLFLFGRSIGGVFAVEVAAHHPAAGLILESTFTTAQDMARRMMPLLPVHWFIRSRFDSISQVGNLRLPKLFLHGTQDEVVPYELGRKLFNAAAEPKTFYDIEGAGHNDTTHTGGPDYFNALDRFITQTLKQRVAPTHEPGPPS